MEARKTVGEPAAPPVEGWTRTINLISPFRAVWWLVTNVRFAILLLVVMASVSLLGVVIPQMPTNVRGDATSEADWLKLQHGRFGFLTSPLHDAGIFEHAVHFVDAHAPADQIGIEVHDDRQVGLQVHQCALQPIRTGTFIVRTSAAGCSASSRNSSTPV